MSDAPIVFDRTTMPVLLCVYITRGCEAAFAASTLSPAQLATDFAGIQAEVSAANILCAIQRAYDIELLEDDTEDEEDDDEPQDNAVNRDAPRPMGASASGGTARRATSGTLGAGRPKNSGTSWAKSLPYRTPSNGRGGR